MASLPPALPNSSTSRGLEINSFQGSSPKLTFLQQPGPCSLEKIAASPQEIEAKVRQDSPSPELLSSENFPESPPESEFWLVGGLEETIALAAKYPVDSAMHKTLSLVAEEYPYYRKANEQHPWHGWAVVLYAYFEILNRWPIQDLPNQKNLMSTFAKNKSDTTKLGQMYGAGEKAMLSLHDALHHKKDWLEFVKKTINQRHTVLPLILYIKNLTKAQLQKDDPSLAVEKTNYCELHIEPDSGVLENRGFSYLVTWLLITLHRTSVSIEIDWIGQRVDLPSPGFAGELMKGWDRLPFLSLLDKGCYNILYKEQPVEKSTPSVSPFADQGLLSPSKPGDKCYGNTRRINSRVEWIYPSLYDRQLISEAKLPPLVTLIDSKHEGCFPVHLRLAAVKQSPDPGNYREGERQFGESWRQSTHSVFDEFWENKYTWIVAHDSFEEIAANQEEEKGKEREKHKAGRKVKRSSREDQKRLVSSVGKGPQRRNS